MNRKTADKARPQADSALMATDPEIMGGVPVFAGTRVPVEMVLSSLEAGVQKIRCRRGVLIPSK